MRNEKDALGTLALPDDVYYGVQTERARQNFAISGLTIGDHSHFIWSLAAIKMAAARANQEIGITANREVCLAHAKSSIALVTILSPIFGYQKTVEIAQHALSENKSIKAAAIESGLLSNEEADELLNPMNLTHPVKCSTLLNHYTRLKPAQAVKSEKG